MNLNFGSKNVLEVCYDTNAPVKFKIQSHEFLKILSQQEKQI